MSISAAEGRRWGTQSSLDRVRAAVESADLRPTKAGFDFKVECPAHGERTQSLHVTYSATERRVLLHCFGCKAEEESLAEAMGLGLVDLYDDPPPCRDCGPGVRHADRRDCPTWGKPHPGSRPPTARQVPSAATRPARPRPGPLPKPLAPRAAKSDHQHQLRQVLAYDYCDAEGTLVQQVRRFQCADNTCSHKTFDQQYVDTAGKYIDHKPEGFTPVLYQLPEVLAAVQDGRAVLLCEGEKDCDTATTLGVVATTNAMGALSFPAELAPVFAGADVRVMVDRDLAGYARAAKLHAQLTEAGAAQVRLYLPAVKTAKADLSDHVLAGHGLGELVEVTVAEVAAWEAAEAAVQKATGRAGIQACALEAQLQMDHATARAEAGAKVAADQHTANARRWASEAARRLEQLVPVVEAGLAEAGQAKTAWAKEATAVLRRCLTKAKAHNQSAHQVAGLKVDEPATPTRSPSPRASSSEDGDQEEIDSTDNESNVVDHPTKATQPHPGHLIPMSRGAWAYATGKGTMARGVYTKVDARWMKVAPLPCVRARIVRRDGTGRRCGTDYQLAVDEDSLAVTVNHDKLRDGSWANDLGLPLSDDAKVMNAASTAIREHAANSPEHEAVPRIDANGQVSVPVSDTLPPGYLDTSAAERIEGLQAWAQIIHACESAPRIALTLGASAVAPFVKAMGRQSHFVALYGDSDQGKTITASLAAAVWGNHDGGVLQNWNTSSVGIGRFLGNLGLLPAFFDEAGTNRVKGHADWGRLIYELCEGGQRMTADTRSAGFRMSAPWHGILISSGNGRMTAELGAGAFAGVGKRVIDLATPFTTSKEHADQLKPLRDKAFGHAGNEILQRYAAEDVQALVDRASARIGSPAAAIQSTIAAHLHSHIAGAAMLDQIAGTGTVLQDAAAEAAVEYLDQWVAPEHDADRVIRQVLDAIAREPAMWPTVSEYQEHRQPKPDFDLPSHSTGRVLLPQHGINRNLSGLRDDQGRWVAVFAEPWKELCAREDVDQSVACRELHARGVLMVPESSRRRGNWATMIFAAGTRLYKLDLTRAIPADPDHDEDDPPPRPTVPSAQTGFPSAEPVAVPAEWVTPGGLGGVIAGNDPSHCESIASDIAGTNKPLTCSIASIASIAGDSLHVPARGVAIPSDQALAGQDAPAAGERDLAPREVLDGLLDSEGEATMHLSASEFTDQDGAKVHAVGGLAVDACLGCGAPTSYWVQGQPWHPLHWEATTSAQRAEMVPAPAEPTKWDAVLAQAARESELADDEAAAATVQVTPPASTQPAHRRVATTRAVAAPVTTHAVAVVDVDQVWLPDGTSKDLPFPIEHLGHLEDLGRTLGLAVPGFKWRDSGGSAQVVPTAALWRQLGVPVDEIPKNRRELPKWLETVSDGLPALTNAVAGGWVFGRGDGAPKLRGTIRLRPAGAERGTVAIVFLPGLSNDLPAITGDIPPATVARRLQLFVDTVGIPFAGSPISTAMDLLNVVMPRKYRESWDVVDYDNVGPARHMNLEPDFNFVRTPSSDEQHRAFMHVYDRNGSYLAAMSSTVFGVGAPQHHPDGLEFNPKLAGWWKVLVPETSNVFCPNLLDPTGKEAGLVRWMTTPALAYAASALDVKVEVQEAWVWPAERCGRLLEPFYKVLAQARTELINAGGDDAVAVEKLVKMLYKHANGWWIANDAKGSRAYQPYWHHAVRAAARVAVLHTVLAIGKQSGTWPLAVANIDAIGYASDVPDSATAWPGRDDGRVKLGSKLGTELGGFKPARSGHLSACLPKLEQGHLPDRDVLVDVDQWGPQAGEGS